MKAKIENIVSKVADKTRSSVNGAVDLTQNQVGKAGKLVAEGKKPVKRVADASHALNAISYRMAKDLIALQAVSVQSSIDEIAKSLRDAAKANTFGALLKQQRGMLPAAASRSVNELRKAFGIVRSAASEVGTVAKDLTSVKKSPKKAAKKAAKTVAKKASKTKAKAKVSAKKVAKKVATKANVAADTVKAA